jgi:hypothetical protein
VLEAYSNSAQRLLEAAQLLARQDGPFGVVRDDANSRVEAVIQRGMSLQLHRDAFGGRG